MGGGGGGKRVLVIVAKKRSLHVHLDLPGGRRRHSMRTFLPSWKRFSLFFSNDKFAIFFANGANLQSLSLLCKLCFTSKGPRGKKLGFCFDFLGGGEKYIDWKCVSFAETAYDDDDVSVVRFVCSRMGQNVKWQILCFAYAHNTHYQHRRHPFPHWQQCNIGFSKKGTIIKIASHSVL